MENNAPVFNSFEKPYAECFGTWSPFNLGTIEIVPVLYKHHHVYGFEGDWAVMYKVYNLVCPGSHEFLASTSHPQSIL